MASFFSKFVSAATEAVKAVQDTANALSLDNLQKDFGDLDGRKTLYAGLDVTYLTPRLISMGFPSTQSTRIRSRNDAASVASFLAERHGSLDRVLVINLSDEVYDTAVFGGNVLEVRFPGYPSPPLGLLLRLCCCIDTWLGADPAHVVAMHCMTGRGGGRTTVVAACALAWMGEYEGDPMAAVMAVGDRRKQGTGVIPHASDSAAIAAGTGQGDRLLAPSHVRYAHYFSSLLDAASPIPAAVRAHARSGSYFILKSIILSEVPNFVEDAVAAVERGEARAEGEASGAFEVVATAASAALDVTTSVVLPLSDRILSDVSDGGRGQAADGPRARTAPPSGCCPFLQIFAAGVLVWSGGAPAPGDEGLQGEEGRGEPLPWRYCSEGTVAWPVGARVSGDLLLVCRHVPSGSREGKDSGRETIFRAALHTSCIPGLAETEEGGGVGGAILRLNKRDLDVACSDPRVMDSFTLDIVLAGWGGEGETAPCRAQGGAAAGLFSMRGPTGPRSAVLASLMPEGGDGGVLPDALLSPGHPVWGAAEVKAQARARGREERERAARLAPGTGAGMASLGSSLTATLGSLGSELEAGAAGVPATASSLGSALGTVSDALSGGLGQFGQFAIHGTQLSNLLGGAQGMGLGHMDAAALVTRAGVHARELGREIRVAVVREAEGLGREAAAIGREALGAMGRGVGPVAPTPAPAPLRQVWAPAPAPAIDAVDACATELAELEALEKELGLSMGTGEARLSTANTSVGGADSAASEGRVPVGASEAQLDVGTKGEAGATNDIDDLEAYLDSVK